MSLDAVFGAVPADVRRVLDRALEGRDVDVDDAVLLCGARGPSLHALVAVADHLRRAQVGDQVGYVVNRNINFTNVCAKACRFCAFSRTRRSEEGYFLPIEEIVRRALEAQSFGATEICVQAGLAPGIDARFYIDLVAALKAAAPALHVHAMSPEEVKFAATGSGWSFRRVLEAMKDAGLGSLPGTSAEVLDDRVRARIAPGRITTAEWVDVVTTAHAIGLRTTSTIMYGHVETDVERMRHLDLLRSIQRETGGFTEFVPLSFVHEEAPMTLRQQLPELRPGPTGDDVIRLYAISRLMLGSTIQNLQVSWVKDGMRQAQWLLSCGANDFGGTLINESISTAAGATHGQLQTPSALRRAIRDAGRTPVERSTRYDVLRTFPLEAGPDEHEPLDGVSDPEAVFGSYDRLARDERFRFRLPVAAP
ncbi:MAG TPA: 5-amino-6-(D-ribitylamino)uracil--L-tyrosine 4-hydroxyphenyl transferase CofH [Polyangiaceae bacterium]|nr:5-amino-6-(D-ribitylamino)uracil--L-tyrosine 4-hydroxyphenyl transferase CofH [Polyangiaceae bacterium]